MMLYMGSTNESVQVQNLSGLLGTGVPHHPLVEVLDDVAEGGLPPWRGTRSSCGVGGWRSPYGGLRLKQQRSAGE
jgi:hypothetical protein